MRAVLIEQFARPLTLADVADPRASNDEVSVNLYYAAVNPLDIAVISGRVAADSPLPRIPGVDGSGYVGGKPVLVHGAWIGVRRDGTWAERIVAPPSAIQPIPDGVALDVAAACGNTGSAAIRLVELSQAQRGDRVLVLAAAGAVGMAVSSLLSAAGVEVWGQIRRPEVMASVASMGATPIIMATPDSVVDALQGMKPTVVIDCLGGSWTGAVGKTLDNDARHMIFGAAAGATAEIDLLGFYRRGGMLRGYRGMAEPPEVVRQAGQKALLAMAQGRMKIPIGCHLDFEAAPTAVGLMSTSRAGKIIIDIRS